MIRRFLAPLEITRPHNMLAAALSVAAGYYLAGGRQASLAALPVALTALITGAGNVVNDYFDLAIDRINKPRRPLPSQRLAPGQALTLYALLSFVFLVGCAFVRPLSLAVLLLLWHVALIAYAARLKRLLFIGNGLVASLAGSAFFAGALLGGDIRVAFVPGALAFSFVLAREVIKGCEDVVGDSASGVRTLAVVFGVHRSSRVAAALMVGFTLLLPLPTVAGTYGMTYLLMMVLLVAPGLVAGAWMVVRSPERQTFNRVSWMLKLGMFFGIVAIALG
ncbi:MAG: geranylgeranylglycerol-phosphate geranylgeranyltransferase [Candidatus Krumholzibacteriota bacterium]|nr:geranylgeranylglycerol-phosphate geranylgeranyltransferase [Candidatus Krumholzibacteriota bacterium]